MKACLNFIFSFSLMKKKQIPMPVVLYRDVPNARLYIHSGCI